MKSIEISASCVTPMSDGGISLRPLAPGYSNVCIGTVEFRGGSVHLIARPL